MANNATKSSFEASVSQAVVDTFKSSLKSSVKSEQVTTFKYMVRTGDHVVLKQAVMHMNYRGRPMKIQSQYFTHTNIPESVEETDDETDVETDETDT